MKSWLKGASLTMFLVFLVAVSAVGVVTLMGSSKFGTMHFAHADGLAGVAAEREADAGLDSGVALSPPAYFHGSKSGLLPQVDPAP